MKYVNGQLSKFIIALKHNTLCQIKHINLVTLFPEKLTTNYFISFMTVKYMNKT